MHSSSAHFMHAVIDAFDHWHLISAFTSARLSFIQWFTWFNVALTNVSASTVVGASAQCSSHISLATQWFYKGFGLVTGVL